MGERRSGKGVCSSFQKKKFKGWASQYVVEVGSGEGRGVPNGPRLAQRVSSLFLRKEIQGTPFAFSPRHLRYDTLVVQAGGVVIAEHGELPRDLQLVSRGVQTDERHCCSCCCALLRCEAEDACSMLKGRAQLVHSFGVRTEAAAVSPGHWLSTQGI